jgi:uncharacterized protein involved in outer membrane biogenesis
MIPYGQFLTRYGHFFVRHRKKILIWTAACLAVFTLVGFFAVPPILKSVLTKQLTAALRRDASIREVRVNPFTLSATLRGVAVKEPRGPDTFASFEELYVNLEASSLFRWAVVVKEIRLSKPFIRLVRRQDESYNFSDLLEVQEAQPTPATKPLRFSLNNIRITDGGVDFEDGPAQTKTPSGNECRHPVPLDHPLQVETFVQPFSAVINGTRYAVEERPSHSPSPRRQRWMSTSPTSTSLYLAYVPRSC